MKTCPYCAEQIPNNATKCKFCGEKLGEDVEMEEVKTAMIKTKEIKGNDESLVTSKIVDHLEFLGYECKKTDSNEKSDTLVCKNTAKSNIVITYNKNVNVAFFRARYTLKNEGEIKLDKEYYEIYNSINTQTSFTKRYSSIDDKVVLINIEGTFNGYEKKSFGSFVDVFEGEISKYLSFFKNY